jgi:DMSO/TMAO reductase YedYZ molybdopterin-dependent catalytic subunit
MPAGHAHSEPDWVHRHPHEPNLAIPAGDGAFAVELPAGAARSFTLADLQQMPTVTVDDCYIVSTGHGVSGPFRFTGVTLRELLRRVLPADLAWRHVDVVSIDGFGTRLLPGDLADPPAGRPPLLAYAVDGAPLTRGQGLVRLIVPAEVDDALRQVKWVSVIRVAEDSSV